MDPRKSAYLEALGVDVYLRRGLEPARGRAAEALPGGPRQDDRALPAALRPDQVPGVASPGTTATDGSPAAGLDWEALQARVTACTRCALHATRTQTVFGVGDRRARWMFVGEAPGAEEDRQGEPFVGRAGQLLTSMIRALGLERGDVYIANVLKCRPPGNRDPKPEEVGQCRHYLDRQIELVDPSLIVAVGRIAAQNLLETDAALARLRGKVHGLGARRRPVIVTYHPAYLLRSPGEKRKAWQDLLFARSVLRRVEAGEPVAG
jgi:uracil-DNA glycosylase family 4